jgi:hypothetical protein
MLDQVQRRKEDIMRKHTIRLALFGLGLLAAPSLAQPVSVNGGDPVAAQADAIGASDMSGLLRQAEQATRAGRLALANEFVERAEALALTRSTLAGTEGIPVREGAVARMAEARAALGRRDTAAAGALIAQAASMTTGM